MGVWLDSRAYFAMAVLGGIGVGGLYSDSECRWQIADSGAIDIAISHGQHLGHGESHAIGIGHQPPALLALSALLTFLTYAWYNTQFMQHQGRYLFTALIPIALAFAVGWDAAVQQGRGRWLAAGLVVFAAGLAAWGVLAGPGLPKWPVAILAAAAVGALLLDLALTRLGRTREQGYPAASRAYDVLAAGRRHFHTPFWP